MIRTIIIEHKTQSLKRLKSELGAFSGIQVIGEAQDRETAVNIIDSLKPDMVMMDMQLPEFSCFDVLDEISYLPMVVFISDYNPYAIKAFDKYGIGYILKPYSREPLEKAFQQVTAMRQKMNRELLSKVRQEIDKRIYTDRFTIKANGQILIVPAENIYYFEARHRSVLIHTYEEVYRYDGVFKELENALDPEVFYQVNPIHIIAYPKLKRMTRRVSGKYTLRLTDKGRTKLKVEKNFLKRLRDKYRADQEME